MGSPTYIPLATVTLTGSDSSITFTSIPATYRDLVLVYAGTSTPTYAGMGGLINGDTGNNYVVVTMYGSGSGSGSSTAETYTNAQYTYFSQIHTSVISTVVIQFFDYSATDKQKSWLSRNSNATNGVEATAGRWASTAAINTLTFTASGGDSFATGSTFNLFGIAG